MLLGTKLTLPDLSWKMPSCIASGRTEFITMLTSITPFWQIDPLTAKSFMSGPAHTVRLYSSHFSFLCVIYTVTTSVHAFVMNEKHMELQIWRDMTDCW